VEQRVLVTVKDAIYFMKNLGEILASQTLHPSIEKTMLDGQVEPPPDAIQAVLRRRRAGDAWLGRFSKVWMRSKREAVVYPSWNNPPH
jgi:hypothetical protein